ncbi:hypothetical protein NDU88_007333 [Pleurodeles waltl]|uniref:Uncharacterized protein n=1 Tax=Pleurodeles waltl TaxID=8319 RepID=A0AAV7RPU4_PLEWA|nr:hypothetical protein NDU88_007333 [Pleurodeles waltl]
MSAVVPLSEDVSGPLAVLAAVSVVAVLAAGSVAAVLAAGSVAAVLAAGSVAAVLVAGSVAAVLAAGSMAAVLAVASVAVVLAAVLVAVQVVLQVAVAVFSAVQVGVDVDTRCDTGPSVGAPMSSPDLPFSLWPFPTFDGGAVVLPLSPFIFADPLVAGVFGFSLWDVGTFLTLAGGGMSLPLLRGTLAALMVGALHDPAVAAPLCLGMWWLRCWARTWKAWP